MLAHDGFQIPGTHEAPVFTAPEIKAVRTHFAGLFGESEIRTGVSGRAIRVRIIIHGAYSTSTALFQYLSTLDKRVGVHGNLVITNHPTQGGTPRTYPNCTFEGFSKAETPDSGPLPDNLGTLDGSNPSWWVAGIVSFRQLKPGDET